MHVDVDVRLVNDLSVRILVGTLPSREVRDLLANELFNDVFQS